MVAATEPGVDVSHPRQVRAEMVEAQPVTMDIVPHAIVVAAELVEEWELQTAGEPLVDIPEDVSRAVGVQDLQVLLAMGVTVAHVHIHQAQAALEAEAEAIMAVVPVGMDQIPHQEVAEVAVLPIPAESAMVQQHQGPIQEMVMFSLPIPRIQEQ